MLDESELYDITRGFIVGTEGPERPRDVVRVLESIKKTIPEHARVLQEYIERLERELEVTDVDA